MIVDPLPTDTGYLINEEDELKQRTLISSMRAIAALYDNQDPDRETEGPTAEESAALWRMMGDQTEEIIDRARFVVVPKQPLKDR